MNRTLLEIPFDHFQRYAAATHLLQALELSASRILEVGANRQRLLGEFLPHASFLYTDLQAEGDERDFVVADATALPFAERGFDAVVSLDVLEHIPAHLRVSAVAEMARVADRAVVIGCPPDKPWVRSAEEDANARWRELFDEDNEWLGEHKEYGLVDGDEVVAVFERAGMQVLRFAQGDTNLWASLMGAHFIKVKFPELEPLVAAADRLYNGRVFAGDTSDQPYREYYVAVRRDGDAARLRASPPFQNQPDEEAVALLSSLARGLRDLALRTANSEREWSATARLLDAYTADLEVAKREWGATAASLHELQAAKDANDAEWQARFAQRDADAREAIERAEAQQRALEFADERLMHTNAQLQRAEAHVQELMGQLAERDRRLVDEQSRIISTQSRLESVIALNAAAYARSRKRWQLATGALLLVSMILGFAVARGAL